MGCSRECGWDLWKVAVRDLPEARRRVQGRRGSSTERCNAAHNIHKMTVPGEQDPQEDLYVVEKGGKLTVLSEDSAIIGKIPKRVRTVRIFADVKEETLLEIIRTRARMLEAQAA